MAGRDDPERELILARRRLFVASALAGAVAAQCDRGPATCLEPPPAAGSTSDAASVVCLSVAVNRDAAPAPCLEVVALEDAGAQPVESGSKPLPSVCLRVRRNEPPVR